MCRMMKKYKENKIYGKQRTRLCIYSDESKLQRGLGEDRQKFAPCGREE